MQVKIGILNIMHDKVDTQKRFRHVLADADLTFFYPKTHYQKRQLPAAFAKIAEPLGLVKVGTMDAFIITGAPIEQIPFDQVDYWDELRQLFAFLDEKQIPQLYVCWGAMAALNYFYGIDKDALAGKLFGIYRQQILQPTPLLAGLASGFKAPHARYAEMSHQDLAKQPELTVNAIFETGKNTAPAPSSRNTTASLPPEEVMTAACPNRSNTSPMKSTWQIPSSPGKRPRSISLPTGWPAFSRRAVARHAAGSPRSKNSNK